jgi:hypothetical protein
MMQCGSKHKKSKQEKKKGKMRVGKGHNFVTVVQEFNVVLIKI